MTPTSRAERVAAVLDGDIVACNTCRYASQHSSACCRRRLQEAGVPVERYRNRLTAALASGFPCWAPDPEGKRLVNSIEKKPHLTPHALRRLGHLRSSRDKQWRRRKGSIYIPSGRSRPPLKGDNVGNLRLSNKQSIASYIMRRKVSRRRILREALFACAIRTRELGKRIRLSDRISRQKVFAGA